MGDIIHFNETKKINNFYENKTINHTADEFRRV